MWMDVESNHDKDRTAPRDTGRWMAVVAATGALLLVAGGLMVWLVTPVGWALAIIGGCLLFGGPLVIPAVASGALRAQDQKVRGRTFVTDMWEATARQQDRDRQQPRDR